ncbi:SDR family oxidoreductase [Mesorhizobium sp. M0833]|uniref:SDR family NAD(P)-dependent oxidoreductase n=1 Tax=Mesorhizobium sp. M0833 TaxID=2957009 RepID=UPI003338F66C
MQQKHSRRNSACYPSLKGKVIFITGGCSGIGAAMIQGFSWQGARVAFVDIEKSLSEALVTSLSEHVYPPVFIECDIRNIAALQMTIERVGRDLGDVSVLINYVANDTRDNRMAINLRPMFFATQAVIPQMKRLGGGSIINFGSLSARTASIIPTYMTAKAGAHGLTTGLARELGPFNIRVNTLLPGWVMSGHCCATGFTFPTRRYGRTVDAGTRRHQKGGRAFRRLASARAYIVEVSLQESTREGLNYELHAC